MEMLMAVGEIIGNLGSLIWMIVAIASRDVLDRQTALLWAILLQVLIL